MQKTIRTICVLLVYFFGMLPLSAQYVTKEAAKEKAYAFLKRSANLKSETKKAPRKAPALTLASNRDEFYAFNDQANGGYVVISAEERMPDVLAYSYNSHFDADNMPCNMRAWMEKYAQQVQYLRTHPEAKAVQQTASERTNVAPLLSCWFYQGYPYNNKCPEVNGEHCVTGCVATAMAQIMHRWQWPNQTTAVIPAYTSYSLNMTVPAIPVTAIDWGNILEKYTFSYNSYFQNGEIVVDYVNDFSDQQANAIATLMQLCGSSVNMNYGLNESSAAPGDVINAFSQYFGYSNIMYYNFRMLMDTSEWEYLMYDEVSEGRPVFYSAESPTQGGHAFVLDGYENGYFHVNWGWGGSESYVSMYSTEGWNGYTTYDSVIIGIQPDKPENPTQYAALNNGVMTLYYDKEKDNRAGIILPNMKEWANYKGEVTECVIDPSFANFKLRDLGSFFDGWVNLKSIKGLKYLNTEKVSNMYRMFAGCSNLTSLDVSGFNTEHVIYFDDMFIGCCNLTSLDVSSFSTKNATETIRMFCGCSNLTTIYASELWDMSNVARSSDMFYDCPKLVGGAGTTFSWDNVDGGFAHIDGGPSNPGYFTYKDPSGIMTPLSNGVRPSDVYNLGGVKVRNAKQGSNGLPSGVYIIDNKRVLVK